MQYKTTSYDSLINEFQQRKFTLNDIKSFVYKVFAMYERATVGKELVPAEAFSELVASDIHVDFPDYKIRSREEFLEWHRWIHGLLVSDDHDIDKLEVLFLANGKYEVRFKVRWRGEFKDGTYTDLKLEQRWILREEEQLEHPVIERYIATIDDLMPGMTAAEADSE
ncbi:hypothetical protein JCM19231_3613 [Vibrio ishigakensis]|uniref:SnoaL-like domain-containing protein n=1 Tax=Vibrio ishigakensis TaxID=1481914 RepID=A0A0B8NSG4_9VIBR|nr:hypothetical protein [Vibrio ishigakensis]GAM54093.1 hypothetical protein JCM19231_3613 [Vibrio ishigakensis]